MRPFCTFFAAILLTSFASAQPKVVAYVPTWIDMPAFADTIDWAKLTHVNIAFANPKSDQGDLSINKDTQAFIAKAKKGGVQVLISIGGGAAAEDKTLKPRYTALMSEKNRAGFAAKFAEFVESHHLDGLDFDIEGPSIGKDYGPFIAELSKALKPKKKLLTAALSKGYGGSNVPDSVFEHFDFINIMAYDGTGPWNPKDAGPHSSMDFAKQSVDYWLKRGLPKAKAVLGVPFYGYGFGEAFRKRDYPYKEIVAKFPGAENTDQTGNAIYYNGIPTIKAKARYVVEQELGGVMIWSLDTDAAGDKSLLKAIGEGLKAKR